VDDYPDGYPRLAVFMNSDSKFVVYRRFGMLHARLLLHLQNKIAAMERRLNLLDKKLDAEPLGDSPLYRWDEEKAGLQQLEQEHLELIGRIKESLKEYDELLLREHQLRSIPTPTERNIKSVYNFIWNYQPLYSREQKYIRHVEDMVTPGSSGEDTGVHELVHNFFQSLPSAAQVRLTALVSILYKHDRLVP
jgi:hypothetical protein